LLSEKGVAVTYLPPEDADAARIFQRTNWSHLLDPKHFARSDSASEKHLAAMRYSDAGEQRELVRAVVDRVLGATVIHSSALDALEWALSEITDNVLTHAAAPEGGIAQLEVMKERIAFCVVDAGRGIPCTLRTAFPHLKRDREALEHAVLPGVTRDSSIGQGNGLSGSLNLAIAFKGLFAIRSDFANLIWQAQSDPRAQEFASPYPGTVVDLQMRPDIDIDVGPVIVGDANSRYRAISSIEERYRSDDSRSLMVRMGEETFGFGTRVAGQRMRTKLLNLLHSDDDGALLVVDWTGVPVIASSYADEAVGKLFVGKRPTSPR
jgi:anti-sigma regulatory factor (Ser/Thr protein kinase)